MKFREYLNEMAVNPKDMKRESIPEFTDKIKAEFEKIIDGKLKKLSLGKTGKVRVIVSLDDLGKDSKSDIISYIHYIFLE